MFCRLSKFLTSRFGNVATSALGNGCPTKGDILRGYDGRADWPRGPIGPVKSDKIHDRCLSDANPNDGPSQHKQCEGLSFRIGERLDRVSYCEVILPRKKTGSSPLAAITLTVCKDPPVPHSWRLSVGLIVSYLGTFSHKSPFGQAFTH